MPAPTTQQPTHEELLRNLQVLFERTETIVQGAARRGIGHNTFRQMIDRGEVESIRLGRDVRVWRDDETA
ncbi:hypothetical protein [Mycolicibacterium septicum]|uniref:hypothetical protein n=1 Tax=Mycolicibacterium septicum TaxID=98668 RepID=UPI0023617DEE|nr:hypothetical protein [Mycolicibacterium septicum]